MTRNPSLFRLSVFLLTVAFPLLFSPWVRNASGDVPQLSEEESGTDEESSVVEKTSPYFEQLVPPDRSVQRRYDQATRLIEAGRYPEAAQILGLILTESGDFFVQPPWNQAARRDDFERTVHRTFHDELIEKIENMPPAGREAYSLQYETQAKRLLEIAVRDGSIAGIRQVAKGFYPTRHGRMAAFLVGMDQFEQGAWDAAMLTLAKLSQNESDSTPYEPTLSLTLALCQLRAGREGEARWTIDRLIRRQPDLKIRLFNEPRWTPRSAEEILEKLVPLAEAPDSVSISRWLERTGWLLNRGTVSQNPETAAEEPLLELLWRVPSQDAPALEQDVSILQGVLRRARETYLPATQPLLVQDLVVMRGPGRIMAVDVKTGKRIWSEEEAEYRLPATAQTQFASNWKIASRYPRSALRLFFWHDRIAHQMSSDGNRIFAVEGLEMQPMRFNAWGMARRPLQIGNRRIEDPTQGPGNTLTARDVKTGRTLWQIGKFPYAQKVFDNTTRDIEQSKQSNSEAKKAPANEPNAGKDDDAKRKGLEASPTDDFSDEDLFLAETWFLGAPLPHQGRLFALGENGGILRLLVLDPESGRLIRQQPIAQPQTSFDNDMLRRYYALTPSASSGLLLCPTGTGLVAALDATTARPLWCFSYLSATPEAGTDPGVRFPQGRYMALGGGNWGNDDFRLFFSQSGWQAPSIMIDGNRVLVAPPDVPALYCLDLLTGRLLWKKEDLRRDDVLYVACIRNEIAYVVTPISMFALSMKDGRPVWNVLLPARGPVRRINIQTEEKIETDEEDHQFQAEPGKPPTESPLPSLAFPKPFRPTGMGVHNGNRFFQPLTDGCLAVIDLDRAVVEILSSRLNGNLPESSEEKEDIGLRQVSEDPFWLDIGGLPSMSSNRGSSNWSPETSLQSLFRREVVLGNLVGIQGRFISQSPDSTVSFDQRESLRQRAETLLRENPDDPEGLLQQGRIRRAEGDVDEAIELFRRSLKVRPSPRTADHLRHLLREAVDHDYARWNMYDKELETLSEFPEEQADIQYLLARGSLENRHADKFREALGKILLLESGNPLQVEVDEYLSSRLSRAIGALLEKRLRQSSYAEIKESLQQTAESVFRIFESSSPDTSKELESLFSVSGFESKNSGRSWWDQDTVTPGVEIRHWQVFQDLFRTLPIGGEAKKQLKRHYDRTRFYLGAEMLTDIPVEWFLPEFPRADFDPTKSALTLKPAPASPPSPPKWKKPLPPMEEARHLATCLETLDNRSDAFYLYRMLKQCYGEEGEAIYREKLRTPEYESIERREITPIVWPKGTAVLRDEERIVGQTTSGRGQQPTGSLARIVMGLQGRYRTPPSVQPIPYLGTYEPFFSPVSFALETSVDSESNLICYDSLGEERWRCNISQFSPEIANYGHFGTNRYNYRAGIIDQTLYLKGCNHLLLLIRPGERSGEIIALDTFNRPEGGPKVLWTRSVSSPLPSRQTFSSLEVNHLWILGQNERAYPRESVFLSPKILCYRDGEHVHGLDPLTGRTLWSRRLLSTSCSLHGDREHLFLVYPDLRKAVAVDPVSGEELASGTIPPVCVFAGETNLVFLKFVASLSGGRTSVFQLLTCDLRDLFLSKRERALLVSDGFTTDSYSSLPSYLIREGLSSESMLKTFHHGRFLASVSWGSMTLQVYDLLEKRDVLGPTGDWGRLLGVKLPEMKIRGRKEHSCDFDVELFEGRFLVTFIEKGEIDQRAKHLQEDGVRFTRTLNEVTNLPTRSIGVGSMMLYAPDGTACWEKETRIEDWFHVLNVPDRSPLSLFAVSFNDQDAKGPRPSTAVMGIDKRTGELRFRSRIPVSKTRPPTTFQGFRVLVAPDAGEFILETPGRRVTVAFTGDPAEESKEASALPEHRSGELSSMHEVPSDP